MNQGDHKYSIVLGQRMSWPELLSRAIETETLGFDSLFLVDHFYGLKDLDDPTHEAYTMLAALAPFTQRIRLGVMVCGNTYRNPAFLLKQAMTVDHVSGGRVDFGVGAGWVEREHEAYGWDFPSARERVDRFAEALEIWRLLQTEDRTTYQGTYYQLLEAPFQPKSQQPGGLPVLIGGTGSRMLRLTARYASIWNVVGTPDEAAAVNARMDEACVAEGRDPSTLVRSCSPSINLLTSAQAFEEGIAAYHAAGIRDIYMPWPRTEAEVPVLREIARNVLPRLRGSNTVNPGIIIGRVAVTDDDLPRLVDLLSDLAPLSRKVLQHLIDHADERIDGAGIQAALGVERHSEVTLSFADLGGRFTGAGFNRPWNEAQRGYLVECATAELLGRALQQV